MALKAWHSFCQAIRERPIRLLVVLGLPVEIVAAFWVLIWLVGRGGYDGRGISQFRLALFLTMMASLALFWVSFRLWSSGNNPSLLSSPRALCRAVMRRPIRLLSATLIVIGSVAVVHAGGVCLLGLLWVAIMSVQYGFDWAFHWSEAFLPMLLVTPVVGAGAGLVWLALRVWDPAKNVGRRFLLWLLLAALFYAVAFGVCYTALIRPPVPSR